MAVQNDTITGTITLTSGVVAFTTSGTNMLTRGHLAGDTIMRNGLVLVIGEITGENTGNLRDVCPAGAAGTAVPVRIRYQPDGSRVAAQARALIDLLGNGNVSAFSSLAFIADRLVYANGPGTLALTPFTSYARSLVDDIDSASMRNTLEIPTLLASIGLGITANPTLAATVSDGSLPTGIYAYDSTTFGSPSGNGVLLHTARSATSHVQLAMGIGGNSGNVWVRTDASGVWTDWIVLEYTQVVTNGNGIAYRFASGLQVCFQPNGWSVDTNTANGSGARGSQTWTFPAAFFSTATMVAWSMTQSPSRWGGSANAITTTTCSLNHFSNTLSATTSLLFGVAIGRWK